MRMLAILKTVSIPVAAALGGALLFLGFGQLYAGTGASCAILCKPHTASAYGAVMGLSVYWSLFRGARR